MEFGDFMGLATAVFGLISVVGIAAETYKRRLAFKERELELLAHQASANAAQHAAQAERLEARVRVLERIATDKGADLALQIEGLREAPEQLRSIAQ